MSREQEKNSRPSPAHPYVTKEETTKEMRQLQTLWRRLPTEHQVTLGLQFVETILKGEYRQHFLQVYAEKHRLKTSELDYAYPTMEISKTDLQQANLDDLEIDQLGVEHRIKIAETMRSHHIYDLFWPELLHIARVLLTTPEETSKEPLIIKNKKLPEN